MRKANPMTYVDASDPPFKLYHGTFDCAVPPHQSVLMDSALQSVGVYSSLVLLQHYPQGFRPDAQQKREMLAFLSSRLTGCGPTGVDDGGKSELPLRFELEQNYPHPFNPSTTIRFSIPQREHATLKGFDVLSREVATLAKREMEPGEHSVVFDVKGLASGVYFCRLQAGEFVQQRKREVIK
ncbi:MAG: hypothetical protein C4326_13205 [Ignavibacteria bacterium]